MLPTANESPFEDARRKVELVGVRQRRVLDTCGGLGYFAAWCVRLGATRVLSCEKNPQVLWLRVTESLVARPDAVLEVLNVAIETHIETLADASFDVVLHDPPRFGIAGELYSRQFYEQLARVLRPGGTLFHYTGQPNRLTSGRDVPGEVLRAPAGQRLSGAARARWRARPAQYSNRYDRPTLLPGSLSGVVPCTVAVPVPIRV